MNKRGRPVSNRVCSVEGCDKKHTAKGYCKQHYVRYWKTGNPVLHRETKSPICTIEGCERETFSLNMCNPHYQQDYLRRRYATPRKVLVTHHAYKGDGVTYEAIHCRTRRERGLASNQVCVDCGDKAREWSLNHDAPEKYLVEYKGREVYVSMDANDYEARCVSCHRQYDLRWEAA